MEADADPGSESALQCTYQYSVTYEKFKLLYFFCVEKIIKYIFVSGNQKKNTKKQILLENALNNHIIRAENTSFFFKPVIVNFLNFCSLSVT